MTKLTDLVPLDKVNALVPQRAGPVRVDLRGNVPRKHQGNKRKSSKHQKKKFKASKVQSIKASLFLRRKGVWQ